MELQVFAIIAIVFLVSLCSLLFINKQFIKIQLSGGKTFDDVLFEKRQFADKLYGTSTGKNSNKKNPKKLNEKNNKKNKDRSNNNKKNLDKGAVSSDVDVPSDSGSGEEGNASPTPDNKLHVEFVEAEIIAADYNTVIKKSLTSGKRAQQQAAVRKNSSTKPPGGSILINKNDSARPSLSNVTVELNHFEESQPKDDLEIRKHRDESVGNAGHKKEAKKSAGGKQGKKEHSPKQAAAATNAIQESKEPSIVNAVNEIVTAAAIAAQKESPKNQPNKQSKKKKNDALLVQKLVDAGVASTTTDDVNVNIIMQFLGRTELTRSEIQILIDFLLNKQQDSINVNNCDWSDDIVQKLRRQLEDKDRQLNEEQAAAVALQSKLRELRAELNSERVQAHHRVNSNADKLASLTDELHQLQQEYQLSTERAVNDKKALEYQLKQLQAKLYQEKQLQSQETAQKLQQLTETNSTLTADLLSKNAGIQELQEKFLHMRDESLTKLNEYEKKFQEYVRQSEADVAHLNTENQRLRGECSRKDEYEKVIARQTAQLEQLEARLAEQSKANNHLDDTSKVEIRNLQNALDSTKAELSLSRKEAADSNKSVSDLTTQLTDLKRSQETSNQSSQEQYAKQVEELNASIKSYQSLIAEKDATLSEYKSKVEDASSSQREKELFDELASYKAKNNDLRQKNWKLVDALRTAEDKANKSSSSNHSNLDVNNHVDDRVAALTDEQIRTKQILERLFPNAVTKSSTHKSADSYSDWLSTITTHIENYLEQQQHQTNENSRNSISKSNGTADGSDDGAKQITEELILQNAKLKSTVDEYKTIVAETESVLTNLEKKVKEQDSYWRSIVNSKDGEIENLKQNPVASS